VIAGLALWWVAVHRRGRVVITSKDSRQLDEQTYPALAKHAGKLPGWRFLSRSVESPTGGKIVLFTTDEPGRAEGWHKEDDIDGPLLIIVNEAKSVQDAIFEAFDRCTYNGLLYISSAGLMMGRFYESHTKLAASFRRKIVRLEDCPHIPPERVDDILRMYGRNSSFAKSTLFSEFMSEDEANAFVMPLELVRRTLDSPPPHRSGDVSAFCDFAAGGDENILAIRRGNKIEIAAAWRERDTMASVGRFIAEFRRAGLAQEEIFGDDGGLGRPVMDRMWELGWQINRVNFGGTPHDPAYKNRGAEMWHELAAALTKKEVILPDDGALIAQLSTRRAKVESDGRLGVEAKDVMRREGLPSPDRADAVCGAWACRARPEVEVMGGCDVEDEEAYPGMDAG
jgi:hypothetical protein